LENFPNYEERVIKCAKSFIRDYLKAPYSASFVSCEIQQQKLDRFLVVAEVDAQNAFGVYLRKRFAVILRLGKSIKYYASDQGIIEIDRGDNEYLKIEFLKKMNGF
jgi:hypothetical protein